MKHFEFLYKLLKDREHQVIAEIGVYKGGTTQYLLDNLRGIKKYYAVDLWKHYEDFTEILDPKRTMINDDMDLIYNNFLRRLFDYRWKIQVLRMTSAAAANEVEDKSLDLVFIDANHAYNYVKEDITVWLPKVKKGGFISGHDYGLEHRKPKFGVTQAVNELIPDAEIKGTVWYWEKDK